MTKQRAKRSGVAANNVPTSSQETTGAAIRREWERGTAMVSLFVATGSFFERRKDHDVKASRVKPANIIIVSEPGRGKTELLDRFRSNRNISYHSDLTVRGLWGLLSKAEHGLVTHIGATEFQKFFQRKSATADNLFGTLVQAMEEGVDVVSVGMQRKKYNHARLGIIAAITNGTLEARQEYLKEMGFMSRAAVFPWALPSDEVREIMRNISEGTIDLSPVRLNLPEVAIPVELPPELSHHLESFVWANWRGEALRVFTRFRQMVMASALLAGRDVCKPQDLEVFHEFDSYWHSMITE